MSATPSAGIPAGQKLRAFIEAVWNQGDADAAGHYLAPAYTIHHDPGDPWEGQTLNIAGFQNRLRILRAPFPDQRFEFQDVVAGMAGSDAHASRVAMTWRWTGTHGGDLPGFPATGRIIRMSGATVYYLDEWGRFTGHWQIIDRLGVYAQLRQNAASAPDPAAAH